VKSWQPALARVAPCERLVRSASAFTVRRCQIVLMRAQEGLKAAEIGRRLRCSDQFMRIALNPGGGSGGPILLAGTNTVLAVNSYVTHSNCGVVGYSFRVDTSGVLSWVGTFF